MEYMAMAELTATGFALLAQIAREPISAYGLTRLMRKNLHYLWPRAESRIYSEVRRLEGAGYAMAAEHAVGRRARRVMTITPAGRDALGRWLKKPVASGIAIESEALLRVFFATLGSVDDLRRALHQVNAEAQGLLDVAADIGEAYLAGGGTAPEQLPVRAMMHEILTRYGLLLRDWSAAQLNATAAWRDLDPAGKQRQARAHFSRTMAELRERGHDAPGQEPITPRRPRLCRG
jgi:PadR family transcriptional regulator, regulatory protein AphA